MLLLLAEEYFNHAKPEKLTKPTATMQMNLASKNAKAAVSREATTEAKGSTKGGGSPNASSPKGGGTLPKDIDAHDINFLNGGDNCAGCTIAGDATFKGYPASALNHGTVDVEDTL